METVLSVVVGIFFATGIYLMLSRQLVRILLGVSIFSNAVNLSIFTMGRLTPSGAPPVLTETTAQPIAPDPDAVEAAGAAMTANPLPQALILTAIVISFSIFAFLLVLTLRAYQRLDTDDINEMRIAEPVGRPAPPLEY